MTTTLIFDADGTLYDETMPKAKAELLTAQLIASRTGYGEGEVYNLFREVKGEITQSGSLSPDPQQPHCLVCRDFAANEHFTW